MNNFIDKTDGFKTNNVFYTNTVNSYFEKRHWYASDKAGLVTENLCKVKNDFEKCGVFYRLLLCPRFK